MVKMSKLDQVLRSLKGDAELRQFVMDSRILTDDLSLELIKRIGGPHSPMAISELPIPNFPRDTALARLYELERQKVFVSKLDKKGKDYVRVFYPTPEAKKLARMILRSRNN